MYRARWPGYSFVAFRGRRASREASVQLLDTVVLWAHAISGATWLGASACFVIAGLALTAGSAEQQRFLDRGVARINQLALAAAILLVVTGVFNLSRAFAMRAGALSLAFICVLGAKIALYFLMLWALSIAIRALAAARGDRPAGNTDAYDATRAMSAMVRAHGAIVAMSVVALMLGLWLTGA